MGVPGKAPLTFDVSRTVALLTSAGNAFLSWAGSKRKLLPCLLKCLPKRYDRYVEPFAGSACLFFALQPKKAVLGDINRELMTTYVEVRDRVEEVIKRLARMRRGE